MPRPVRVARRRARAVVLTLALAVMLTAIAAACGGPGAPSGSPTPVPSGVVALDAKEYAFSPAALTVPAGPARFSLRNAGSLEHEFELFSGDKLVGEIKGLTPGLTRDVTVTLAAGDYTFVCKLSGHDQLGMKGTLTVTPG